MHNYYCKNCNNLLGKWNDVYKYYNNFSCYHIKSKNINSIYFLDCKKCNKFVGIICYYVCKNCFGKNEICGEEILFNWFLKYAKTIKYINYEFICKICNKKNDYRWQLWFFKELTFYK